MCNFKTGLGITLIILVIRHYSWYIISNKKRKNDAKRRKPAQVIPTFLSMIVDKKAICYYNQLYIVASSNIWH